jgi:hypothetical protein
MNFSSLNEYENYTIFTYLLLSISIILLIFTYKGRLDQDNYLPVQSNIICLLVLAFSLSIFILSQLYTEKVDWYTYYLMCLVTLI